ncbi:MAG TPA: fibronectin type III domain-containing protein [Spongiibacteraceae bacterium]|nr:fibronectin type III domain-containing protein [Spongiibacteraceae bacterium]
MRSFRTLSIIVLCVWLSGCSGHSPWSGSGSNDDNPTGVPSAPVGLAANAGDRAVSLGWTAPATNGSGSLTYTVTISPSTSTAQFTINGTAALIRGLNNETTYTFSVIAGNSAGTGTAASIQAKPTTGGISDYALVTLSNKPLISNGLSDPSLLHANDGRVWMAYSDVSLNNSGQIVRSATRIAHSEDSGKNYIYDQEVGTLLPATRLSDSGQWQYRTPWLIEDSSDPDANRRFKLFAHKYFLNTVNNSVDYRTGSVVMWTAAAPDGNWSTELSLLGWKSSSTSLTASTFVDSLDTSLQSCLWVDEGSAALYGGAIDMVVSCVIDNNTVPTQKRTVLLRSIDHMKSLTYVATLLQSEDAQAYDADTFAFNSPSLLPNASNAPVLIVTPIDGNGNATGCIIFPIANEQNGSLFTTNNIPVSIQSLLPAGNNNGSCAWDRGILAGILMSDRSASIYTLRATGKSL